MYFILLAKVLYIALFPLSSFGLDWTWCIHTLDLCDNFHGCDFLCWSFEFNLAFSHSKSEISYQCDSFGSNWSWRFRTPGVKMCTAVISSVASELRSCKQTRCVHTLDVKFNKICSWTSKWTWHFHTLVWKFLKLWLILS